MVFTQVRPWIIKWLYLMALVNFGMGVVLSWLIQLPYFASYNQLILSKFWASDLPPHALELHLWWLNLFGATLQNLAIFMGLLIYIGNRIHSSALWGWMIIGFVVWAPQDMFISAQRDVGMHLWIDALVLLLTLPPLVLLWRNDKVRFK